MTFQSGRNLLVGYKVESVFGALPGASSADVLRVNSGGLSLTKAPINSNENRRDGQRTRGRHGSRNVAGQYVGDISLGSYDDFIEAVFRGTFTSALTITEATASLTSITTTEHTIVAGGGSWITAGLAVGDVIRLSGHSSAGNNGRNIRISGLTASTITTPETLTENAVADTSFTVTRAKKLLMGTTARSFTIEEAELDIDGSEVFKGCRIGSLQIQLQPNGMGLLTFGIVGQDMEVMTDSSSPYFTNPTATTSIGMTAVEAVLRVGSSDVVDLTALDITINLNASGQPVVASNLTPEVFTNQAMVEGSFTALKSDVTRQQAFLAETEMSLHLMFTENESEPKDYCSFYIGNLTFAGGSKSDIGQDNGRTQTFQLLIGKDERGGAYDATTVKYQTSAA